MPLQLDPSLAAPTDARALRTTDDAVRGIAAIMARSFGLPVPGSVVVLVYGGRRAFEQGLMRDARVSPLPVRVWWLHKACRDPLGLGANW